MRTKNLISAAHAWRARVRVPDLLASMTEVPIVVALVVGSGICVSGPPATALNALAFFERTQIDPVLDQFGATVSFSDASDFLGSPNFNLQRTEDVEAGDVNADGFPDLVEFNAEAFPQAETIVVRINNQLGGFSDPIALDLPTAFRRTGKIGLEDLDGDGFDDLVVIDRDAQKVEVYLNSATGPTWFDLTNADFEAVVDSCPTSVAVGNVVGDSAPDLVVSQSPSNFGSTGFCNVPAGTARTLVFENRIASAVPPAPLFALSAELDSGMVLNTNDVFLIDSDDDGDLDIVNVNAVVPAELFRNESGGAFAFVASIGTGFDAYAGEAGDLNADGKADIVLGGEDPAGSSVLAVYLNSGGATGSFSKLGQFGLGGSVTSDRVFDVSIADVDLDGDMDILGAWTFVSASVSEIEGRGGVSILGNDGTAPSPTFTTIFDSTFFEGNHPSGFNPERFSAEFLDHDQDGDFDIYTTGGVFFASLAGSPVLAATPNQFYENLAVAYDVDSDGIADLVDNCPNNANPGQVDSNLDGVGNVCDPSGFNGPPTVSFALGIPPSGKVNVSSGSWVWFGVQASDSDGLGYPIFQAFGNSTPISYNWLIGDAQLQAGPSWLYVYQSSLRLKFTLQPGEQQRTFFVTVFVYDTLGNWTARIVEVDVTL